MMAAVTDREVWALQRSGELREENAAVLEAVEQAMARLRAAVKKVVQSAPRTALK